MARIAAIILLLNLSVIAGSFENDGRWFRLGSRMGLTGIDVVTDAEREVYASNYGQGGALTIDAAIEVASNFYLHVAAGLDYRWFDEFGVLNIECDGDCGGYWNGYNETSFRYLELPLLTQWRTSALFLEIGPVIDLLLVKDEGVDSGIFDSKLSEAFVATIPVDYDSRKIKANKDFARWQSQIGKPCNIVVP